LKQIRSMVFLDAYVPQNGQSIHSLTSERLRETVNAAIKRGDIGMPPARAASCAWKGSAKATPACVSARMWR